MDKTLETAESRPSQDGDDEISLIDLFAVLLRYKKMIITISAVTAVCIVIFAAVSILLPPEKSYMPNLYTPAAHMLINDASSSGGSISSMLSSSGLSGLAGLAGVNVSGGSTYSALATYLAGSDPLYDAVTDKFGIVERYKIKKNPRTASRKALKKHLKAEFDEDSSVFTVSFTDYDPVFAQQVVDFTVDWLQQRFDELGIDKNKIAKENLEKNMTASWNEILRLQKENRNVGATVSEGGAAWNIRTVTTQAGKIQMELSAQQQVYTQLKTQYELLKVQMASDTPVFQILERPEVPDMKSGPGRGKLCIIAVFAAFFISVFLAFALNALENIRKDPEAMHKLHGRKTAEATHE